MDALYVCAQGHEWEGEELPCPICGGASVSSCPETQLGVPDELPPPPRAARPIGQLALPGYEILAELGRGGMGVVYKARQKSLNRLVAVKVLLNGALADADELARFRREAEAVAQVRHPHIVQVHDVAEHQGWLYCVLEYVEGGTLADRLRAGLPSPEQAAETLEILARAVHAAHEAGIIHRDLKPANVLLTADGQPKIADFGLARRLDQAGGRTTPGAIMGTPSYMAPEQAQAQHAEVTRATDVYALGAILYELLTARPPFIADNPYEVVRQVISEQPVRPGKVRPAVPAELERICLKALDKVPVRRFPTALALAEECRRFRSAGPPAPRRRGALVPVACAALLLLAAVVLGLWWSFGRGPGVAAEPKARWEFFRISQAEETFDRIAFPTRQVGFAASRQALYRSDDGGETWRRLDLPAPGRVHVLAFGDDRNGWLGTTRLLQTDDGGQSWREVPWPGAESMKAVSALASGSDWLLAGGTTSAGELRLVSRRGGQTWEALDGEKSGYWGGSEAPYRGWYLGGLAVLSEREAVAILHEGREGGGAVLRTGDGGLSWRPVLTTETDLHRVAFGTARRGLVSSEDGALWATQDGGQSWKRQTLPVECETAPRLVAAPDGGLTLALRWRGQVLLSARDEPWAVVDLAEGDFGYSMPDAAAVDGGWAVVLSSDGRVVCYVDPRVPANR